MPCGKKQQFKVVGVYDTETTNIYTNGKWQAFPCLFIYNDISNVEIENYVAGESDNVQLYRHDYEFLAKLQAVIKQAAGDYVPIVCAYNLMFDLQPIQYQLAQLYNCDCCAQSSTHCYTFDLKRDGTILLRFWDTYFLEMRGLAAMGQVAGLPKAIGSWDYDLIRTPDTPLTAAERHYAARDVQVIPAYLRFLLESNRWLKTDMLGVNVLTKTSVVRQMAKHELGSLSVNVENRKRYTLLSAFIQTATANSVQDFETYALRKACFRGGFTFTAAKYAHRTMYNVLSLDVCSMHHLFINGCFTPQHFRQAKPELLTLLAHAIVKRPRKYVLEYYYKPFHDALHVLIRFDGLRLKVGSAFALHEIGLIPQAKFHRNVQCETDNDNMRNIIAENDTRALGYVDTATGAVFAYSKLMSARTCLIYVTELELYTISRVYDWDDMRVICGEYATQFYRPCDYVSLQSNVLFNQKSAAKDITKHYREGVSYTREISNSVPGALADAIKAGNVTSDFLKSWYGTTVKGNFNGIYGTQAMNEYRPDYIVNSDGELVVNDASRVNCANFNSVKPKKSKVHYTYGMRIVGGSRLHLVLAIELLHERFNMQIKILGGDTDSLKVSVPDTISDKDIMIALQPLHDAATNAINYTQKRIRATWPNKASKLTNIGHFEVEKNEQGTTRYPQHMEIWPKARVSYDGQHVHVTCAGLSRPAGAFTIEDFIESFIVSGYQFDATVPLCIGYNVTVSNEICHSLERTQPGTQNMFNSAVTDYLGKTTHVRTFASCALYNASRVLGDTFKIANSFNVTYQKRHNRQMLTLPRTLKLQGDYCIITSNTNGDVIACAKRIDRI